MHQTRLTGELDDMLSLRSCILVAIILCCALVSSSCAAKHSAESLKTVDVLSPCPDSPNCVSSDAKDDGHRIAPLTFSIAEAKAWQILKELVLKRPRTIIVTEKPNYLHVTSRSAVFGFVDDLEFQLRAGQGLIAVRSASRTGYYDFGVNRKRVEELRAALLQAGVSP